MTWDTLLAIAFFGLVNTITPGPNNTMLMASGANFGLRRTLPHMLGICLGIMFMVLLIALGISKLFEAVPALHQVLRVIGTAYLLWLAWKIAHAAPPDGNDASGQPLSLLGAAAFQWVNPKAWAWLLSAVTLFLPDPTLGNIIAMVLVFGLVCLPSVGIWAILGTQLRHFLTNQRRLRIFNIVMALLLVASLLPAFLLE